MRLKLKEGLGITFNLRTLAVRKRLHGRFLNLSRQIRGFMSQMSLYVYIERVIIILFNM